jgi:hypothetical protein
VPGDNLGWNVDNAMSEIDEDFMALFGIDEQEKNGLAILKLEQEEK